MAKRLYPNQWTSWPTIGALAILAAACTPAQSEQLWSMDDSTCVLNSTTSPDLSILTLVPSDGAPKTILTLQLPNDREEEFLRVVRAHEPNCHQALVPGCNGFPRVRMLRASDGKLLDSGPSQGIYMSADWEREEANYWASAGVDLNEILAKGSQIEHFEYTVYYDNDTSETNDDIPVFSESFVVSELQKAAADTASCRIALIERVRRDRATSEQ